MGSSADFLMFLRQLQWSLLQFHAQLVEKTMTLNKVSETAMVFQMLNLFGFPWTKHSCYINKYIDQ